jgi:hypothetical protein
MPVPPGKEGCKDRVVIDLLLAISAHQVLARSLLTVASMQKSHAKSAALPDPRNRDTLGLPDHGFEGSAFRRIEPPRTCAFITRTALC